MTTLLSSCGADESGLIGYVPAFDKDVSRVVVGEVSDSTTKPFAFKAATNEVLCPTTLYAVKSAKKKIGEDLAARVDLAMVTVDPERDTSEKLPKYLASFSDRFHAIVPTTDSELRAAEDAFQVTSSVTKQTDGTIEVAHSATAYVVDDTGRVVVEWPFGLDADAMANDLRFVLSDEA
jgi:protein SCO1/2